MIHGRFMPMKPLQPVSIPLQEVRVKKIQREIKNSEVTLRIVYPGKNGGDPQFLEYKKHNSQKPRQSVEALLGHITES